ncbi:MAG: hypothetical protein AAGE52_32245 [Myxococcota bacterium]
MGAAALATLPGGMLVARSQPRAPERFLFVISAAGGGSIIDSFLPVWEGDVSTPAKARGLVTYPELALAQPAGSALRCVRNLGIGGLFRNDYDVADFLQRHARDTCVVTVENTSVNHVVAQKRAINGAGIDGGRTLMEAMAMAHGDGLLLPNCNMSTGGYLEPGDAAVPAAVRSEIITDPSLFAIGTHGSRGVRSAPGSDVIARARGARSELEAASGFGAGSALRDRYLSLRDALGPRLESEDLIRKLMLIEEGEDAPLTEFDLASSPDGPALRERFRFLGDDTLHTQAALAFLLAKYGVACALTFGPKFQPSILTGGQIVDTPLAFDYSHTNHVESQNVMWSRIMEAADGLIRMLQDTPHGEGTMWDRSLIYIATDFGRSKTRPNGSLAFGSGHHLNNGNVFISPLLRGNRVFGWVDPETCLTWGFDPTSGEPAPEGEVMREGHLYSLVCDAMGIDFDGKIDMRGLLR